jgi:hypothetical protein
MACTDCLQNCPQIISDDCVKYTGEEIPLLGICTGDQLSKVEEAVIDALLTALDGSGITLSDLNLTSCPDLQTLFGTQSKTLLNLMQFLYDQQCTLKEAIEDLAPTTLVFDKKCLTGLPTDPGTVDYLQAAVTLLCSHATTLASLSTTYVNLTDLNTLIAQYLSDTSTSSYKDKLVPGIVYPYNGSLSNFDNTGKGLSASGFDKIYLCNGLNGTSDYRGRALVGAVRNVPGGSFDTAVDPTLVANPSMNYALGDKFGSGWITLTTTQIPSHTHTVTDPGHTHTSSMPPLDGGRCSGGDCLKPAAASGSNVTTASAFTGITIASTGGSQPHDNRQPSVAVNYIIYIP